MPLFFQLLLQCSEKLLLESKILYSIGLQDKENFFLDELINIINDLWYEIDNN